MIEFTPPHPYLDTIRVWYEDSFPADERRAFAQLLTLLPDPAMHLYALLHEGQLVGFVTYWQWPDADLLFVEHFAIDPARRGQQLGRQALATLFQINGSHVVLETELPTDAVSERRVRFYERNGFQRSPFAYVQPPYQPGHPAIPMLLLAKPGIQQQSEFETVSSLIRERVYERFY